MKAARHHLRRARDVSLSRPCGASRRQAWRPRIKFRPSAVRSNGRRRDPVARQAPRAAARRGEIKEDKAIEDSKLALIENGKEAFLRMREKIGKRHLAGQNESDRAGEDAEEKQNAAGELQKARDAQERQEPNVVEHCDMRKAE